MLLAGLSILPENAGTDPKHNGALPAFPGAGEPGQAPLQQTSLNVKGAPANKPVATDGRWTGKV